MFGSWPILSTIVFSPLLGILALLFVPKHKGRALKTVAIAATLVPLVLSALLYADFRHDASELQYKEDVTWIQVPLSKEISQISEAKEFYYQFDYTLGIDGLSLPLVFLTSLVTAMAALASVHLKKRWKAFYIWFLLLEIGMFGVFMARDLFLFFLFFELTLIPMFFLIGIWGYMDREKAANKFLIYNGIGSAIMLLAFLIIVNTAGFTMQTVGEATSVFYSGSLDVITKNLFQDPAAFVHAGPEAFPENPFYWSDTLKWTLFLMLLVAFGIKLPIFPFHTWMLKVHTEAHPAVVMIHSGILLKMGAYGLLTFGVMLFPEQAKQAALAIAILGVVNILYGAVLAFRQSDFKLILAYSSISHMGVVLLGIAAFNEIGLKGAIFQLVSHGLISALMFLLVGSLYERTETTEVRKLGGLSATLPFLCGFLLVAGMASLGLPLLSGFVSEFLAFLGLFDSMPVVTAIGALGIILTAVYVLRGIMKVSYGPLPEAYRGLRDARLVEAVPMITLTAFIVLIGVYPAVLSEPMQQTVIGIDQWIQNIAKMGG
ncbi:complex I subunit 4 family protein [Paenibacillus flagellatus]|uniref:NADH-quinone oxidoreductase subunit M n=1 Tax=Paenibacillus flagellatus TaxID=2211139 RepID=A0A2V5JWG4_9BACL|nr:NADH-quinone oxidoreductase subunit M [Paenibacillus flagellatus]PYI51145.1 NADH-quinone oxidoreductase subunit M [Paenibacillus flagellatus]